MAEGFGRESALALLREWTASESLRKHGMAVSVCTEAYGRLEAERLGLSGAAAEAFVEAYACAGLLHDMDYERHAPLEEHAFVGVAHRGGVGWPEEVLRALVGHGGCSGVGGAWDRARALRGGGGGFDDDGFEAEVVAVDGGVADAEVVGEATEEEAGKVAVF